MMSKRGMPNLDIGDMSYQNDCNGASYDLELAIYY